MTPAPVQLEEVSSFEGLEEAWQALAAAHGGGAPFLTFEWVTAWQRHFMEHRFLVHDRPLFHVARAPGGQVVAMVPLMITRRPAFGAVSRVVDFLGADPYVTELRGMLCDPAWEEAVAGALVERLLERRGEWDRAHLRGLVAGGGGERRLAALPGVTFDREVPAYLLPLPGTWEEVKAGASRNLKESLRHCYNSLKRDGIDFELRVARTPDEVRVGVETFLRLHRSRAERSDTVAHGDVFSSPVSRAFLADVCDRLARRDQVRIFQLCIGGEVVATRVGFALGDTLYLYFSGYLPQWGKYSIMTTTVAEAIRHAIGAGFRRVHLSTGTDVSKTRWRPAQAVYRDAVLVSPTVRGRLAHRGLTAARGALASSFLKQLLGRRSNAR